MPTKKTTTKKKPTPAATEKPKPAEPSPPPTSGSASGAPSGGTSGGEKRRYRLTADFKTKQGAVWPKGTEIDATESEIRERKIHAEPSDG